jgi:DNA polymerase III delta subunit
MHIFLTGDDTVTVRMRKDALKKGFFEQFPEGKLQVYSFLPGDREVFNQVVEDLAQGFFSFPELLLLEEASNLSRKEQKLLLAAMSQKPKEKQCIGIENKSLPKGDALYKDLTAAGFVIEVYPKKERSRKALVEGLWQKHQGKELPSKLVTEISARVTDDDELLTRLETALLYSGGKEISPEDLEVLVPQSLEAKIFDALDLLAAGKKEKSLVLFRILLEQDDVFRTLGMCAWQIRQMLTVEGYIIQGITDKTKISELTKIHPFVVQKIQGTLSSFPHRRLVKSLGLLAQIDRGLKKSEYTSVSALDTFVLKM